MAGLGGTFDVALLAIGIDAALVILILEAALLVLLARQGRIALSGISIVLIAGAGLGLLLALRGAMTGAAPHWMALCLSLAGVCHMADVIRRIQNRR
jgi:hypothetical protein